MNIKNIMRFIIFASYIVFFMICERMMGCSGSGIMGISFLVYSMFFLVFMGSVKETLAKMVSIRRHRGFVDNAKRIFGYCVFYCAVVSVVGIAASYFLSGKISEKVCGDRSIEAVLIILGVFFALEAFSATIRGYYIGCNGSIFLTIGELVKCISMIVLTPIGIKYLGGLGTKAANLHKNEFLTTVYGSMGAAVALCVADILMLIVLLLGLKGALRNDSFSFNEVRSRDGFKSFTRAFVPLTLGWLQKNIMPTLSIFVLVCFYCRFCGKHGIDFVTMYSEAGALFVPAFVVFFVALMCFKKYAGLYRKKLRVDFKKDDKKSLVSDFNILLKNAMVVAIPMSLTIMTLSGNIAVAFFGCERESAGKMLLQVGILVLFACFDYLFAEVLECIGHDMLGFACRAVGFVLSLIMALSLNSKDFNITFVVTALLIGYGVCAVMGCSFVVRFMKLRTNDIVARLVKVVIASGILVVVDIIFAKLIPANAIAVIIAVFVGYVFYMLVLMASKAFSTKDIQGLKGSLLYYPLTLLGNVFRIR